MDVLSALRRITREKAIDSILDEAAHGIAVREIVVGCVRDGETWMLVADYVLAGARDSKDSRPLLVDASRCPLAVESLTCAAATDESLRPATSRTWMLRLRPGVRSWEGVVLRCRLPLPNAGNGARAIAAVSIPDHVPRVLSRGAAGPLPFVQVDGGLDGWRVCGVSRSAEAFGPALLQAVLIAPEMASRDWTSQPVQILGRLRQDVATAEGERAVRLVHNILDFHSAFLGLPVAGRVAVLPAEQVPASAHGAMLGIRGVRAFGLAGQDEPDDVMLGSRLAGLWWGAGCRITGSRAPEMEAALRGVAGMLWADHVDGPYRGNVLRDWEQNAATPRMLDGWRGAQGAFRHGVHARWSLEIYNAARHGSRVRDTIKHLTQQAWGRFTPAEEIIASLGSAGLSLR